MKILFLNAWGGTCAEALLPYLAETDPDIACIQEVVSSPETDLAELEYRDGAHILPQRANFFRELSEALPNHTAIFCPAARDILWNSADAIPSFWGLATFVRGRIPIIGQSQGFVHKDYGADGYGAHPRSRSAHAVRVYDHKLDRAMTVTHMHGLRDLRGKMDTPERSVQAERFLELSASVTRPDDVAVLCGDFNVEPGSKTLGMVQDAGFTELVTHFDHPTTRSALYKKPSLFADYMAINTLDAVRSFDVIKEPVVSDHCPLVLTLR